MPPQRQNANVELSLRRLVYFFSAMAALLWLIGIFGPHRAFFPTGANFEDIIVYRGRFTVFHTLKFFKSRAFSGFAYPAGSAPVYEAFYKTPDPIFTYLLIAAIAVLLGLITTYFFLRRHKGDSLISAFFLLSFPFIFLIQRANIELILWIVVAFGILAYRKGYAIPAAILFGLAASMKLYPILLLGLFLKRRCDVSAFVVGLATAIVATCAAIVYAGPTFTLAAQGFFTGVDRFQDHYAETVRSAEINYDHSLFSPIKYWSHLAHASLKPWLTPYYLCAASFAGLIFLRVRTMPFLNRLTFLLVAMISLPPVSYSYTLVHLYLPTILLVAAINTTRQPITAKASLAVMLFLLLPIIAISTWHTIPAGPLQSFAVLLLYPLAALTPWQDPTNHIDDL